MFNNKRKIKMFIFSFTFLLLVILRMLLANAVNKRNYTEVGVYKMFTRITILDILCIIVALLNLITGLIPSQFSILSTFLTLGTLVFSIYIFALDLKQPSAVSDKLRKK